ncbi:hypothetical protein GGF32_000495 [Allomyces javanicus]|nr:hypothetical protein GGF32_000495 [Allomyces javanicus]
MSPNVNDEHIADLAPNLPSVVAPIQAIAHHSTNLQYPVPPLEDLAIPLIIEIFTGLHHAASTLASTTSRTAQLESDLAAATSRATTLAADLAATQSVLQVAEHDRAAARDQLALAIDAARQVESHARDLDSRVVAERKARHAQVHAINARLATVVAKSRASEIARWCAVAETIEGLCGGATCHEDETNSPRGESPTSVRDAEARVQGALARLAIGIQDDRHAHEVDVTALGQRVAELERDLHAAVEKERETRKALGEQATEFHEHHVEREAQVGVLVAESSANIETLTAVAKELDGKLARASKDQALLRAQFLKAREELRAAQGSWADAQDEIAQLRRANQAHVRALASLRSARAAALPSTSAAATPTAPPAPAAKTGPEDSPPFDPPKPDPVAHLRAELKRKATLIHHLQMQLATATETTAALAADAERSVDHFRRQLHDAKARIRSLEGVVREVVRWCVSHARPPLQSVDKVAVLEAAPSPALAARADRIARTFLNVSYDDLQRQVVRKESGEMGRFGAWVAIRVDGT